MGRRRLGMAITAMLSAWVPPGSGAATEATDPTGTGTARKLAERWGAELKVDPDLAWAARMRARRLLQPGASPPEAWLDQLKRTRLGDAHMTPWVAIGVNPANLVDRLGHEARPRSGRSAPTHVGAGWARAGQRWAVVVLLARRWVDWRVHREAGGLTATGRPLTRLQRPELQVFELGPCQGIRCPLEQRTLRPPYRLEVRPKPRDGFRAVEVLADTESGPTVVGLWWFGTPPAPPAPDCPPAQWLTAIRKEAGHGALRFDDRLRRAAEDHARQVCPKGWAAHRIHPQSGPGQRARARGFEAPVGENVAVASSRARAHRNLWLSPAHRRLLLDPDVAAAGVAETRVGTRVCLVQLFGFGR